MERTVTVKSWNGDRKVTKEEFVKRWTDQVADLWAICYTAEDHQKRQAIQTDLATIASNAFEVLLTEEEQPA